MLYLLSLIKLSFKQFANRPQKIKCVKFTCRSRVDILQQTTLLHFMRLIMVFKKKDIQRSKVKIVKFVKKFSGIEYIFHTEYVRK